MKLRYYQSAAIDALFDYWDAEAGNPLIDLATGAGKSLVMSEIIIQLLEGWPGLRIGVITHVKELIEQNYEELKGMWKLAPAGIVSAGVGKYDYGAQVMFAGIQTVWNKVEFIGDMARFEMSGAVRDRPFDIILIDECHLIPPDDGKMYTSFFRDCREANPEVKLVGLTATPYRLGTGRLDSGEGRLFDRVVYTYSIADGVRDGYLTPLTTKGTSVEISAKGVRKDAKGEFSQKSAAKAADEITSEAVAEIIRRGQDRRSWMLFCSGKDHAFTCRDEIRAWGITCEAVTDETPKGERRDILAAYKNYEIRSLTNNAVLTTGFNHKGVDLIAFMRLTMSVSLYLQMAGRGTRPIYRDGFNEHDPRWTAEDRRAAIAEGPKPNCLVLDFARLVDTHGPVDSVTVDELTKGDGEAPSKMCPTNSEDAGIDEWEEGRTGDLHAPRGPIFGCGEKLHAAARFCKECGFRFTFETGPKIDSVAADKPIMAEAEPEWRTVSRRAFKLNQGRNGKKDTVMVLYYCETGNNITEWLCPEHQGWMARKASSFWTSHGGELPVPIDCVEWIERQNELGKTYKIEVKPGKKGYWDVMRTVPLDPAPEDGNAGLFVKSGGKRKTKSRAVFNDEIPF